jgi:hypothetical protein
MSMT